MSLGLSQIGATSRTTAYVVTPSLHATLAQPATAAANELSLYRMSSQERISAELAMIVDATRRSLAVENQDRARINPLGGLIDLRV